VSAAFSNGMLARFAVFAALGAGAITYGEVGLTRSGTEPMLSPILAGVASYLVAVLVFYVGFGLLSMHWFGRRYWVASAAWGALWLGAFYLLGEDWLEPIGFAAAILTVVIIGIVLPKGGLTVPGEDWKHGGPK